MNSLSMVSNLTKIDNFSMQISLWINRAWSDYHIVNVLHEVKLSIVKQNLLEWLTKKSFNFISSPRNSWNISLGLLLKDGQT